MTDAPPVVAESGHALAALLLESKCSVPPRRRDAVSRRHLIDRAREGAATVVAVTAAAGYGKSTMLAEWAALESRAVAWVSLESTDDDPAALLSVIASASAAFSPAAAAIVADMRGVGASSLGRSATLLATVLADAPGAFVLFLDDVHDVDSLACQDALEVLLSRIPAGSQVVLASRSDPPLLARLRAAGRTYEVSADDLALDVAGARTLFDTAGVEMADGSLARVRDRCEGWPTGLFLCAVIARAGGDADAVTGDHRYLEEYLYRECVARLPLETQRFLRRAAVLDRFSAASCNAVLEIDDARSLIGEIASRHLFLVPVDPAGGWFRFHGLFREFLLGELERAEGRAFVQELHLRAARWHDSHGLRSAGVEHLLRAEAYERAADVVAEISLPMYQSGEISTVERWHATMGESVVRAHPSLAILAAWNGILVGRTADGDRWADTVAEFDVADLPAAERTAFESARAMIRAAMCRDGADRVVADAAYALEHEPSWSPWRDQALHLWGSACLLHGDIAAAAEAFADAVTVAEAAGNWDSVILSEPELALLSIDAGRWSDAAAHAARGVDAIGEHHMEGYPTTALALAVAARVALHRGERGAAQKLVARGMRARVGCTYLLPFLSIRARMQLAKAHLAMEDRSAARHLLREIDDISRRRPDLGTLVAQIGTLRAVVDAQPAASGSVPLTPAELRLLPYLQTHLTIGEIGQRLFVSRNTVSSEVGSIYRKLGVTTRSAAVDRATEVGLLGD